MTTTIWQLTVNWSSWRISERKRPRLDVSIDRSVGPHLLPGVNLRLWGLAAMHSSKFSSKMQNLYLTQTSGLSVESRQSESEIDSSAADWEEAEVEEERSPPPPPPREL